MNNIYIISFVVIVIAILLVLVLSRKNSKEKYTPLPKDDHHPILVSGYNSDQMTRVDLDFVYDAANNDVRIKEGDGYFNGPATSVYGGGNLGGDSILFQTATDKTAILPAGTLRHVLTGGTTDVSPNWKDPVGLANSLGLLPQGSKGDTGSIGPKGDTGVFNGFANLRTPKNTILTGDSTTLGYSFAPNPLVSSANILQSGFLQYGGSYGTNTQLLSYTGYKAPSQLLAQTLGRTSVQKTSDNKIRVI